MAEHRTVDARVVGSTPISHPNKLTSRKPIKYKACERLVFYSKEL